MKFGGFLLHHFDKDFKINQYDAWSSSDGEDQSEKQEAQTALSDEDKDHSEEGAVEEGQKEGGREDLDGESGEDKKAEEVGKQIKPEAEVEAAPAHIDEDGKEIGKDAASDQDKEEMVVGSDVLDTGHPTVCAE